MVQNASSSSRASVVVITLSLFCAVAFANVYVPYFSPEAEAGRERSQAGSGAVSAGPVAGSVWKNMAKKRDAEVLKQQSSSSSSSSSPSLS